MKVYRQYPPSLKRYRWMTCLVTESNMTRPPEKRLLRHVTASGPTPRGYGCECGAGMSMIR